MMVEDPGSHLKPMVNCPDVWRPESNVEVVVSEENGKPMTYTLAIVDEGLLDLTRFKTPNLWNHFLRQRISWCQNLGFLRRDYRSLWLIIT